jgi:hypothetical protein
MMASMSSEQGAHTLPPHFRGFALMHVAMRRDAGRLVLAAPNVTPASLDRVRGWWQRLNDVIDWHHHSEDEILWPELRRQVPGFGAREDALIHDHTELEYAMDRVSAALDRPEPEGLAAAAVHFHRVLHDHLHHEEEVVFPVFADELPVSSYVAIERRIIGSAPAKVMSYLQPWMFDGADRESVRLVAATIPPPVRALGYTVLRLRYQRGVAPLLALA